MGIPAPQGVAASGLPPAGDQANAVLTGTISAVGPTQPFAFRGPMNVAIWAAITTSLATTAGSLSATVGSATGLAAGNSINSPNVPPGTTVGVLVGTAVTLAIPPITLPGAASPSAKAIMGLPLTAGLVGATVVGPGMPAGTTVLAVTTPAISPTASSPSGGAGAPGSPGVVSISNFPTSGLAINDPRSQFTFSRNGNAITATGTDAAAIFTGGAIIYVGAIQIERSFDGGATWTVANIGGAGALAQYAAGTPVNFSFGEPEKYVLYRLNCPAFTSGVINYRISQTGGAAESLAIGPLTNG